MFAFTISIFAFPFINWDIEVLWSINNRTCTGATNSSQLTVTNASTAEEVGNSAVFLCSDLSSGITGEILHVDAGLNIVGFPEIDTFT